VKPIAAGRYVVQFTIGEADHQRLQYALQLMSHRNPQGRLSVLSQAAIETLIAELENEKLGATDDPRESDASPNGRHIPRAVRREVVRRDGWQCSYVSPAGHRCESRWQLEFDHIREFARGGGSTVDNVRLLCRVHNQYAAECTYGAGFMEEKRLRASVPEEAVRERPRDAYSIRPGLRGAFSSSRTPGHHSGRRRPVVRSEVSRRLTDAGLRSSIPDVSLPYRCRRPLPERPRR
jgi:5-methylcytosine-specific restriction endonuclease McrA